MKACLVAFLAFSTSLTYGATIECKARGSSFHKGATIHLKAGTAYTPEMITLHVADHEGGDSVSYSRCRNYSLPPEFSRGHRLVQCAFFEQGYFDSYSNFSFKPDTMELRYVKSDAGERVTEAGFLKPWSTFVCKKR